MLGAVPSIRTVAPSEKLVPVITRVCVLKVSVTLAEPVAVAFAESSNTVPLVIDKTVVLEGIPVPVTDIPCFKLVVLDTVIVASKASVEATKVNLNNAEIKRNRQEELYKKGLISDQEMENTNSSYASALSSFNNAEARYIQDEDALSKLRLIAPQDGTITFIDGEVGDLAQGGMFNPSVLLKLSDLSKMEVYVNVNENDIADISINDTAIIEVDAYQDQKFKGVVKEVAYAATTSSGGSQQQQKQSTKAQRGKKTRTLNNMSQAKEII